MLNCFRGGPKERNHAVWSSNRLNIYLASGILCYFIAGILSFFRPEFSSSALVVDFSSRAAVLLDYFWRVSAAVIAVIVALTLLWFFCFYRAKEKGGKYLQSFKRISFFIRLAVFSFLFICTLFPLNWATSFSRSHASFPEYGPFDFILLLVGLTGTVLCCIYFFKNLPEKVTILVEKAVSCFFEWKETYFVVLLLVFSLLITGIISFTVLDRIPHVQDSIAQLFQAKIFKTGNLYAPLPPQKEFFDYINIINDDKWYSQYPPGHPFLLMLGLYLGAPWLIGPLIGSLSLLVFYLLVKTIYSDKRVRYLSCALMLLSPFFLFMSSNHMNHSSTMFFTLLFLYGWLRMFSSDALLYPLLSGLSLGYAINIRPLSAAAVGAPFICCMLIDAYKKREIKIKKLLVFFTAGAAMICMLLLYNYFTNGDPFMFGYQKKYNTLGFLGSAQEGPQHTIKGGVLNTANNLIGLNKHLFEWPIPSLVFVFMFFFIPGRKNRWDYLLVLTCITFILSYFFYYYQDLCFGPRFYYSLTPLIIVLSVRGFLDLPKWLGKKSFNIRKTEATLFLLLFLCSLYMLSFSLPALVKKYSDDYWWITDKIHIAVKRKGITNAIVFIDVWHPRYITRPNLIPYGSGFLYNSPDLSDEVIYAIDLKQKNHELMQAFPQRNYYLCNIYEPMAGFTITKLNGG